MVIALCQKRTWFPNVEGINLQLVDLGNLHAKKERKRKLATRREGFGASQFKGDQVEQSIIILPESASLLTGIRIKKITLILPKSNFYQLNKYWFFIKYWP